MGSPAQTGTHTWPQPQCPPVYLGPDVGFVNVFTYHDEDDTCQLDLGELASVCREFFQECIDFLESSENPECDPVYLGPEIGFANIFEYHDDDGSCQISMAELSAVCNVYFTECLAFLESSEDPACEPVFLGPDIGFANIMEYHDSDGSCGMSISELASVCQHHFSECLAFLESAEDKTDCEPVYLGPTVGYQMVLRGVPECGGLHWLRALRLRLLLQGG